MSRYCIMSHNRSLPVKLERFRRMLDKNCDLTAIDFWATDADWLITLSKGIYETIWWTAPEDLEPGGVMLVHLRELPADAHPDELLRQAEACARSHERLADNLHHAALLARLYGGTIFCAARVGSIPEQAHCPISGPEDSVVLNLAHIFDNPLPVADIRDVTKIEPELFTGLDRGAFEEIRDRLSWNNRLPDFLLNA